MSKPRRAVDVDGAPIFLVPISRPAGLFAKVDEADFKAWVASGRSLSWRLNSNGDNRFARLLFPDQSVIGCNSTVARTLLGIGRGKRVGYIDRNPLNLRRSNLRVTDGYAKGATPVVDEFTAAARSLAAA